METLRKWRANAEAFLQRLSPRERVLVTLAAGAVAAFVLFLTWHGISGAIRGRESRIEEKTRMLAQVGKLAHGWREAQAQRAEITAKLEGPPLQLVTFVSQTGARLGIEVNDLRPLQATTPPADGLVEDSVEVDLARIEIGKLSGLVQELERGPGVVKVRRLALRTRSDDQTAVDASLVVATYRIAQK
jgi:general secretion pathway protein M